MYIFFNKLNNKNGDNYENKRCDDQRYYFM